MTGEQLAAIELEHRWQRAEKRVAELEAENKRLCDKIIIIKAETIEQACGVLDDARWEQHNLGPDDRLGDGSPAVLAYACKLIKALEQTK